jgi:hypothetical protein
MNSLHKLLAVALVVTVAVLLPGCKKSKNSATEEEGPKGNPILPGHRDVPQGGGAIQGVRRAAQRTADINQLKNFALAYAQFILTNNRGPSSVDDLKDSLDADTVAALKEGFYVAVWNVRNTSSSTIVVYVKDPDRYGTRIVGLADGTARRMEKQEFEAAGKGQ